MEYSNGVIQESLIKKLLARAWPELRETMKDGSSSQDHQKKEANTIPRSKEAKIKGVVHRTSRKSEPWLEEMAAWQDL